MAKVLISPLNWGLGHATRDIPIIKTLIDHGHEVTIAGCGNARSVLEQEFPACASRNFPDYSVPFSANSLFLARFIASFPRLLQGIADERRNLATLLAEENYDLIISDNRLGVYSTEVPSLFISHQLHFHLPMALWPLELAGIGLNGYLHEKFDRVIVPDNPPGPGALGGKLSRAEIDATRDRAYYAGILTSTRVRDVAEDLDYLILISGPEPQRTELEHLLLPQVKDLPGTVTVLLGSPQAAGTTWQQSEQCRILSYASTEEKELLMNRARCIICRSGYTTMMELAELKKRQALLIPTPGQPEQEYLAEYYEQQGWFHARSQHQVDLAADVRDAAGYRGLPYVPGTDENVHRLYDEVLAGYLE